MRDCPADVNDIADLQFFIQIQTLSGFRLKVSFYFDHEEVESQPLTIYNDFYMQVIKGERSELTSLAFSTIPVIGNPILVIGLITFTFFTMLGWYYYGERCAVYLFGEKAIMVYKIIWICGILAGSLAELRIIWNIADVLNGLMTIPNLVAVLLLSKVIAAETKKYSGKHIDDIDGSEVPVIHNSKKGSL